MITITTHTPKDYEPISRAKMKAAGLVKIETDFIHNEDFSGQSFGFGESRYFFNDGTTTNDVKKFRKKVYNY